MTGSVALDVVIGLVFVYTLYSLLTTTVVEMFASFIRLRSSFLEKGIKRMLDDESNNTVFSSKFYGQPLIKYLGKGSVIRKPSYLSAENFSKAVFEILKEGSGATVLERIRATLDDPNNTSETKKFIRSLLEDAQNDLDKFKTLLEKWYDDTMERVTSWYKRRVQLITVIIGFFIAAIFNADTIAIVQILANDEKARDQMVKLAQSYVEKNKKVPVATSDTTANSFDALLETRDQIQEDVNQANSAIGLGWALPDSLVVLSMEKKKSRQKLFPLTNFANKGGLFVVIPRPLDKNLIDKYLLGFNKEKTKIKVTNEWSDQVNYAFCKIISTSTFWGLLLTAIALSLGAPFWFDLLNKLVKLRSSVQVASQSQSTQQTNPQDKSVTTIKRHG